jgi:hypothetical protein
MDTKWVKSKTCAMQKKIYSISLNNTGQLISHTHFPLSTGYEQIVGIQLNEEQIDPSVYNTLEKIDVSYLLILDVSSDTMKKDLLGHHTSLAEKLIPLLMDHSQYQSISSKPVLIQVENYSLPVVEKWNSIFLRELKEFGMHNISACYNTGIAKDGIVLFEEISEGKLLGPGTCSWQVRYSHNFEVDLLSIGIELEPADEALLLLEENERLKLDRATLLKNIYDLNNYYRFVRGETNFKYHNRPDTSAVDEYKAYYTKVYEELPAWYKKFGALLKILLLKRELWYYVSKRHRKIFFDMIYALPDEKQIKTWYYFEYEILPGWYKWIGKLLRK